MVLRIKCSAKKPARTQSRKTIDQTTSAQPQFNDFLLYAYAIMDTVHCSMNHININVTKTTPGTVSIVRNSSAMLKSTYQWGPMGFTPNNGQQMGDTVVNNTATLQFNVPIGAQWLYIKDTCQPFLPFQKWRGPYELDSSGVPILHGLYFIDRDSNCVLDPTDAPIQNAYLLLHNPNATWHWKAVYGNVNGEYFSLLQPGTAYSLFSFNSIFTFSLFKHRTWSCSADTAFINTNLSSVHNHDFAIRPSDTANVRLGPSSWGVTLGIQGFQFNLPFSLTNLHKDPIDTLRLTFHFSDTVILETFYMPGSNLVVGSNPPIFEKYYFNVLNIIHDTIFYKTKVDVSLLNQTTLLTIKADSLPNEQIVFDNTRHFMITSVSAYDPNDKLVSHPGYITDTIDKIHYRIRFQNTGNFPAHTVRVVDTLPSYFANSTFILNETSHSCYTSIDENGVAEFLFYNIQLPDSASNPEGSNGFVDFTLLMDQPMQIGDSIANRAYIYFDFQPPIITNDAWTKHVLPANFSVDEKLPFDFKIYPNPTQNHLSVLLPQSGNYILTIVDLQGRPLITEKIDGFQSAIDVSTLASGMYLVYVKNLNTNRFGTQKLSIIK